MSNIILPTLEQSNLSLGINHCSNAKYHGDNYFLSSSNYKTLLKEPETFYKEKILMQKESKSNSAFDEGSLTHALILEPEVIKDEFAFYEGMTKRGKVYEGFKSAPESQNKIIISKPQRMRCDSYFKAYNNLPAAKDIISGCDFEYTICQDLFGIPTKMRADAINIDKGYIADVKTTRLGSSKDEFKYAIEDFNYGLSAALYCAVAEAYYGKPFDFYFVVISKTNLTCDVLKASSKTMSKGLQQVKEAGLIYKQCASSGIWQLPGAPKKEKKSEYKIEEV